MNLFNNPEIPQPRYRVPETAQQRADKLAKRLAEKIERKKLPEFNAADYNLSSFPHREVKSAFVGQNVYVKPGYVVSMPEYCFFDQETGEIVDRNPRTMTADFLKNQENLLNNDTKGKLSKKAITGLRNSINWLCISARQKRVYVRAKQSSFKFKVNFITLTLPDTDNPITSSELQKQLLNPFLTYMRKYHGLRNYVWRLEFQASGKLHVHLTCDTFLHHKTIRDSWNRLLDKNGYLDQFVKKHRHKDPNSTDVHATKKVKNMAAYLAKYMSKKNSAYTLAAKKPRKLGVHSVKAWYLQRVNFWNSPYNPRPIKGRIWGCSKELSKANKAQVHIPAPECAQELRCFMQGDIMYKQIFAPAPKNVKVSPYGQAEQPAPERKIGEVFFLTASDWFSKVNGVVRRVFEDTRQSVAALCNCLTFELV